MEFRGYDPGEPVEGTEPLEDGRHVVRIVKAEDVLPPDGPGHLRVVFARLEMADRWAWPVCRIGDDARGRRLAVALADAVGLDRATRLVIDPEDVVGQVVEITTARWQGETRSGVAVNAIAAAPARFRREAAAQASEAVTRPRTAAAKVRSAAGQAVGGGDDVPF